MSAQLYKLKENCLEWIFDGCQIVGLAGSVDHVHRSFARRIRIKIVEFSNEFSQAAKFGGPWRETRAVYI
jgi:hypothetical protein